MEMTTNGMTPSDVLQILYLLGYRWSNEVQCYYSPDYDLPVLTGRGGRQLAQQINEAYEVKK